MRLPRTAHTSRPWRIHEFTQDFEVEDVWALPTPGGPQDFGRLVRLFTSGRDGSALSNPVVRVLFAVRWKLGAVLGWDKPGTGVGSGVQSLRERLPADLRDGIRGPDLRTVPFTSVYQTEDEWVAESANRTVHVLMHIGWVPDENGGCSGEMTALVKPNGLVGKVYMAGIRPIRHLVVYPRLIQSIERRWQAAVAG